MYRSIIHLLFCSILGTTSIAQNTTKYSNEFLSIGVGSRFLAMSNGGAALADDVTAAYWNPAGLMGVHTKYEISAMHATYFGGIANYDYISFATTVDRASRVAFSLIRLGVDNIPDTRFLFAQGSAIPDFDNIRSFSIADYALLFSYARRSATIRGLRVGINFKIIYRSADIFANAWGFGLDAGLQYTRKNWNFGLMARDITGTYNTWFVNPETLYDVFSSTGNTIPDNSIEVTLPRLLADIAYKTRLQSVGLTLNIGADLTFDGRRNTLLNTDIFSVDPHAGVELDFKQILFLRAGAGQYQEIKNFDGTFQPSLKPAFGIGFRVKNIILDYTLSNALADGEAIYSHIFSVKVSFNKSSSNIPRYEKEHE